MKRDMEEKFSKMNKKGLSGVVATVILIALVMASVAIVWGVVTNLVSTQLEEAGSCFDVFGKISLNNRYTCYDTTTNTTVIGLSISDIDVGSIVVLISGAGSTKSYEITNDAQTIEGLVNYGGGTDIKLPGKNGGSSYNSSDFNSKPDSIQIAPIIAGKQCEVADSISSIESCALLA